MPKKNIVLNKKDELFIALGKTGVHSFIMLGVMKDGKPTLLARVGKWIVDGDFHSNPIKALRGWARLIFTQVDAELEKESLSPYDELSYSAYAITYSQYLQLLKLVGAAQNERVISGYQPIRDMGDLVIMGFKPLTKPSSEKITDNEKQIINQSHSTSLMGNSCRHTAIKLIEYTQGISHLTDNVSRYFFKNLSLSAKFSKGQPDKYFYVFPLPPNAYELDKDKTVILSRLFQRMENLIKKDPYGETTIKKFEALKKLYNEQAGIPGNNIETALNSIRQWKEENKKIISELRDQSFFGRIFTSKSATQKLTDDIECSLANKLAEKSFTFPSV